VTSDESTFPVVDGPDVTYNSDPADFTGDAFIAKVSPSGASLIYSGFIGGDNADRADGVAVDGDGNAYVVGATISTAATFPVLIGPYLALDPAPAHRRLP
jgi:hypothetical protein